MFRDLTFESPDVSGYGKFEPLTVAGVSIMADSEDDAQSWAKWRLHARIRDFATSERYAAWCEEASAPFDHYEIELPARTQIVRELWIQTTNRPEPKFWHLAAAEDWRL